MDTIHIKSLEDEDTIVKELHQLHEEHTKLFIELREEIRQLESPDLYKVAIRIQDAQPDLQRHQDDYAHIRNADELATKLKKNCSFIDGSILNLSVKFGLTDSKLAVKTEEYVKKAREFANKKSIKILKDQLLEELAKSGNKHRDNCRIHVTLRTTQQWDRVTTSLIKCLIEFLLMRKAIGSNSRSIDVELI